MAGKTPALVVDHLHKSFRGVQAVNDLSFSARRGTVLGLLGSNGAGKTTTVRILSTLLAFDRGTVTVLGKDVVREARAVRAQIGLTGQYAALDQYLTAYENLEMIGRLSRLGVVDARRRAKGLIEVFDLTDAAKRLVKTFSGGMLRRLDLAASLILNPALLILDEPTTGLDPHSRQTVWRLIRGLVSDGTSILLTTQYLEEAEELADDIVVIDHGAVIAQGPPQVLKREIGGSRIEVQLVDDRQAATTVHLLDQFGTSGAHLDADSGIVTVPAFKEPGLQAKVIRSLDVHDIDVADVRLREPTLDEVFLTLTGNTAAEPSGTSLDQGAHP